LLTFLIAGLTCQANMIELTPCYNRLHEVDIVDHMLMGCVYAMKVLFRCFTDGAENLETWWLKKSKRFHSIERRIFDKFVRLI
jgi:hypothetical protein